VPPGRRVGTVLASQGPHQRYDGCRCIGVDYLLETAVGFLPIG
jgi:hypothetical protein